MLDDAGVVVSASHTQNNTGMLSRDANRTGRKNGISSISRAANSLRHSEFGPRRDSKPASTSGSVSAAKLPGRPTAAIISGGRPSIAPTRSTTATIAARTTLRTGIVRITGRLSV